MVSYCEFRTRGGQTGHNPFSSNVRLEGDPTGTLCIVILTLPAGSGSPRHAPDPSRLVLFKSIHRWEREVNDSLKERLPQPRSGVAG